MHASIQTIKWRDIFLPEMKTAKFRNCLACCIIFGPLNITFGLKYHIKSEISQNWLIVLH